MGIKTGIKRRIATVIAIFLALQMIIPAQLVNASVITEDILTATDSVQETGADSISAPAGTDETIGEETGADEVLGDIVSGSEGSSEETDDQLIVPESDESAEAPEHNVISEEEFDADTTTAAAANLKDMTVMLYCVGADLEGNSMAATLDICEIMQGINNSKVNDLDVNFIVETGGVKTDKADRNRDDVIEKRKNALGDTYSSGLDDYQKLYEYLTKGDETDFKGISWLKNERYEIYADEIVKAASQPTDPSRLMTKADNNVLQELAEFIKTTKADYPAKRYMLILWDHGGGPKGGLGNDERDESDEPSTFQAWQIDPTMKAAGVTTRDKFSYINYDACLMGNLETALAWAPYADYFCGSEDLEPGDGDFYENWVSILCKAADDSRNDFSKNAYVNSLMEEIGKKNVNDFYEWYTEVEDNGTKSLIKLSEVGSIASALSGYGKTLSDLIAIDPMEAYFGIYALRAYTQDFNGREAGIVDLNDFITNMSTYYEKIIDQEVAKDSKIKNAVTKFKNAGQKVISSEAKAVLEHKETFQYDDYSLGGVTVFLPYLSETEDVSTYLNGYKSVKTTDQLKDYKTFISTFSAIQAAGELIVDDKTEQADIDSKLKAVLNSYGVGGAYNGKLKTIPSEIMDHRIQQEGMKIFKNGSKYYYKRRDYKLVYDVYQSPIIAVKGDDNADHDRVLGYLCGGPYTDNGEDWSQELINYEEQKWFGFEKGGKYIPVSLYYVDSGGDRMNPGNPFTAKTEMKVPVLYDGRLHMLDVSFDENSDEGKVNGMWPFDYKARTFGRYMSIEQFKSGEITILADVVNAMEGENGVIYDDNEPQQHSLGTITLDANTRLKRGIPLCGDGNNNAEGIGKAEIRYFIRDLFGSFYYFGDIVEDVEVSLRSKAGSKKPGDTIKADELGLKVTGQNGEEYDDSKFKDSAYNYYMLDENGNKKKLIVKDGVFGTDEDDETGPYNATGDPSDVAPVNAEIQVFKPITIDKDIKIIVEPSELNIEEMEKIDGATVDLDKYFNLRPGSLEVTIKAAQRSEDASGQFKNLSKPNAKQALVCDIAPVTYTGRNLLTTQSALNGSKVIELNLYSDDGKNLLKEGTDYTVSYKNNKNAGTQDQAKNPPTLTIVGKNEYKDMKYEAVFTINKADMNDVTLTFDKRFAPLSAKGISLKTKAILPSGIEIPANQLQIHYYLGEDEIGLTQLGQMFTTSQNMIPLTVKAEALTKATNIITGSTTSDFPSNDIIYACPKSSGTFNVSLKSSNVSLKDSKRGDEFLNANFSKANIGRDQLTLGDLWFHGVYYDSNLTRRVDGDMLTTAGKCYIAVSLNAENQKKYSNYSVKALGINVMDGIRLKNTDISVKPAEYKVGLEKLADKPIPVTLVFNKNLSWDKLTLTCSTRDGGSIVKTISADQVNNGKIVLNDIDNSALGNYTIRVGSAGKSTGSLNLTYKVIK